MNTDIHYTATPVLALVPARDVLSVDGIGSPEDPPFGAAVRALFAVRAALGARDGVPLEGSYAQDGDLLRFALDAPTGWHWRLLVPARRGADATAVATAAARFGATVHLRRPRAQTVAQLLHRGPYADEAPSIAALGAFVHERGLTQVGPHTEVYLTDPRSTPPSELRTMLRVAVR